MENNVNEREVVESGITIHEILLIIKRNIILIIASIILFTAIGVGYASLKEPNYTVSNKLSFTCKNLPFVNSSGNEVNPNTTTANINTMLAYGDTLMDLFNEGVVLDRANYYYKEYSNAKLAGVKTVEEFTASLDKQDNYTPSEENLNLGYLSSGSIGVKELSTDEEESKFAFIVSYNAQDVNEAKEKLAILIYAFTKECKELNEEGDIKYFGQFEAIISNEGPAGTVNNVSKVKSVLLFVVIGAVVAALAVCAITLLDNTVKSKEELERIVGAPVFAAVDNEV